MPPADVQTKGFVKGDIVWVHIKGLPWWPGQVMDVAQATEKMKAHKKPNTQPVNTFGDDQFTWAASRSMVSFEEKLETHQQQRISSASLKATFKIAVEEAVQMLDIRAGRTPVTEHHLVDFLNPPPNSPTAPDKSKDFNGYHPPELLSPGDLADQDAEVEDAIVMLQNLAIHPEQGVSIEDKIVRLLYTWRKQKFVEPQQLYGGRRKRKLPERPSSKTPQPASELPAPKKVHKGSSVTEKESIEEEDKTKDEEEDMEVVPENEDLDSDTEVSDIEPEQEASSESEEDEVAVETEDAEVRPAKRRRKAVSIVLSEDNQWQAAQLCDPQDFVDYLRTYASQIACPVTDTTQLDACSYLLREQMFLRSIWRREGSLGPFAQQASVSYLEQQAKQNQVPKAKNQAGGIPCEKPKLGLTAKSKDFANKIPSSSSEFNKLLEDFYNKHGKTITPPIIDGVLLNLERVFRAVADKGGYEAVTLNKLWPSIGRVWRKDLSRSGLSLMHKKYCQHLLAFELELSQGVPEKTVYPTSKAERKDKRALRAEQIAKRIKESSIKRQQVSRKALDRGRAVQEKELPSSHPRETELKTPLVEHDAFAALDSEEDDEPYMRVRQKTSGKGIEPASPLQKKLHAKIKKGNLQRKSELNNETFKSLASDKPDFQKDSSNTGSRVIQETVGALAKPMSERKVVIRIKFAQGIEMPTRQRILSELRKYGHVDHVELLSKQNTYNFRFVSELSASKAFAVLERRASSIWNLPKDSINVFQEIQGRSQPPPRKQQPHAAPKSGAPKSLPAQPTRDPIVKRPVPKPSANAPLKGIMKKASPDNATTTTVPKTGMDPRLTAGIPRGIHPSAPRPNAQPAVYPRPVGGDAMAARPSGGIGTNTTFNPQQQAQDPRQPSVSSWQAEIPARPQQAFTSMQTPAIQNMDFRQAPGNQIQNLQNQNLQNQNLQNQNPQNQNLQSQDPRHSQGGQMRPTGNQMQPPQTNQMQFFQNQGPQLQGPHLHGPQLQGSHLQHLGYQAPQGQALPPPPQNPLDMRQMHGQPFQDHMPMGPFPNLPYRPQYIPQQQPQHVPPSSHAPKPESNKEAAVELSLKMSSMDPAELVRILSNINVPQTNPAQQSQINTASSALPSLDNLFSNAGINPIREHRGNSNGPSQHQAVQNGVQNEAPNLAGETGQSSTADISGPLLEMLTAFGATQ